MRPRDKNGKTAVPHHVRRTERLRKTQQALAFQTKGQGCGARTGKGCPSPSPTRERRGKLPPEVGRFSPNLEPEVKEKGHRLSARPKQPVASRIHVGGFAKEEGPEREQTSDHIRLRQSPGSRKGWWEPEKRREGTARENKGPAPAAAEAQASPNASSLAGSLDRAAAARQEVEARHS